MNSPLIQKLSETHSGLDQRGSIMPSQSKRVIHPPSAGHITLPLIQELLESHGDLDQRGSFPSGHRVRVTHTHCAGRSSLPDHFYHVDPSNPRRAPRVLPDHPSLDNPSNPRRVSYFPSDHFNTAYPLRTCRISCPSNHIVDPKRGHWMDVFLAKPQVVRSPTGRRFATLPFSHTGTVDHVRRAERVTP